VNEEKMISDSYVINGDVQVIFWPNLDGIQAATNIHIVAHCMGLQEPALFWAGHDYFFANQSEFVRAEEQTLIDTAVSLGADATQLQECYENGVGLAQVEALDAIAGERGIRGRPVFDINGIMLFGSQPFGVYAEAIEEGLSN
jgi:predicted DsbA family dithiol-disulfide isomerase